MYRQILDVVENLREQNLIRFDPDSSGPNDPLEILNRGDT